MFHLSKFNINSFFVSIGQSIALHWRGIIASIIITSLALLTLGFQLSTIVDGQNIYETDTLARIESFPNPLDRMINAPYLIPAYFVGKAINNSLIGARIISVLYSLIATCLIFLILKKWLSVQVASVGSLLFITSSWVLALSHQATPWVLLFIGPILLLASLTRFAISKKNPFIPFLLLSASLAFTAYVPLMFWPMVAVILIIVVLYKHIIFALTKKQLTIAFMMYATLLLPLFISITQYPGQLKEIIGIPDTLPTLVNYIQNFFWQFSSIFFIAEPFPELFVGRLPYLDIFTAIMLLLGIYHFIKYMPKRRKLSFLFIIIMFALIVPISYPYQAFMAVYITFIYILAASGIYELLKQWFAYFPRNPYARNTAVILLSILIGFATFYNLQKFYVAWPNAAETKSAYMVQSSNK